MANEPRNEKGQSNSGGSLLSGCLKLVGIVVLTILGGYVLLVFLGKLPFPGATTPEPGVTPPEPIPGLSEVELVEIRPDQDVDIVRTGISLPYITDNCRSPVSTKETITQERTYSFGVELDVSESSTNELVRELTGGNAAITQAEVSVVEDIAQEISRRLGINMNESRSVESSREIETPAGYRSSVSLKWEEAHTIGYATIRIADSGREILIPFSQVSHMHLAQVETVYTSCADGTTVVSSAGGIPVIQSEITAQNLVQIVSPANTECKNPVKFNWVSEPDRQYMVTARPLSTDSQAGVASNWIEGNYWEEGLPANLWGSWEWFVTRDDNVRSAPVVFVFNPFPTKNKDQGCSEARAAVFDDSEITTRSLPSATSTSVVSGAEDLSEPAGLQVPTADEPQVTSPTVTVSSLPTDTISPPYPPPSVSPLVPTPELGPTITPSAAYPYPPPTPFVYP